MTTCTTEGEGTATAHAAASFPSRPPLPPQRIPFSHSIHFPFTWFLIGVHPAAFTFLTILRTLCFCRFQILSDKVSHQNPFRSWFTFQPIKQQCSGLYCCWWQRRSGRRARRAWASGRASPASPSPAAASPPRTSSGAVWLEPLVSSETARTGFS